MEQQLIEFLQTEVVLDDTPVERDTDLLLSGAVDSLGVIRVTQWVEDFTGQPVDPGDVTLENFQSVASIVTYVEAGQAA